jgi:DNA polymerase III subunit delta
MLIFIYGQDDYKIVEKLKNIKNHFISTVDPQSVSIEELDGANLEFSEIKEKTGSLSLFTKKRLLIIYNIFANKKSELLDDLIYLLPRLKEQEANVLCFIEKDFTVNKLNNKQKKLFHLLSQEKFSQEFKILNQSQLLNYAKELFLKKKQKISQSALQLLSQKVGPNLWKLNNEINKLIALGKKDEINIDDIENLIADQSENNIFALSDALANKNSKLSFQILNQEMENKVSLEYILSMLIRQIKILIEVKSDNNRSTATKIGLHPFVLSKSKAQINKFTMPELLSLFDKLINIEYGYKQGKLDLKKALLALV